MAGNRLGRGFAALISDMRELESPEITTYDEKGKLNRGVNEVEIAKVKPNPNQPRKHFDEEALKELALSISNYGILQPLVVVANGEGYEIVAGERRYRSAIIAGLEKVPVIVRELAEKERREIALVENLQREDLNPIEEAEALYRLLNENKLTQEELAAALGKSRPAVANSLRLLTLCPFVRELVRDGELSVGHAKVLMTIKATAAQEALAKEVIAKKLSVRELESRILEQLEGKVKKQPAAKIKNYSLELKELINDMQRVFSTKIKVTGNDNKGKIIIDYYSQDDLQRIYELLEILKEHQ